MRYLLLLIITLFLWVGCSHLEESEYKDILTEEFEELCGEKSINRSAFTEPFFSKLEPELEWVMNATWKLKNSPKSHIFIYVNRCGWTDISYDGDDILKVIKFTNKKTHTEKSESIKRNLSSDPLGESKSTKSE